MNVAVIGTWHVHTEEYALAIRENPASTLACCWDDNAERGKAFAEKMGIEFVADLSTIWNNPAIDSVQITTSTNLHKEVIIAAAQAKKHIFTEKVLAFTNEDAEAIRDAVVESGVKFTISYPHKTWPAVRAAKELVDTGKLGAITYARVRDAHNGCTAGWLPPHFFDESQTGGGAMIDLGAHPMYTLNWFMGEPKSIVSMFTEVTGKGVEDNAVSVIEFADGAIGVSETGFVTDGNPYILEMSGTKGSALVHYDTLEYCSQEDTDRKWVTMETLPPVQPLPIHQWVEAVSTGSEAPALYGIEEAVTLTKFMVGAYAAYQSGKKYNFS